MEQSREKFKLENIQGREERLKEKVRTLYLQLEEAASSLTKGQYERTHLVEKLSKTMDKDVHAKVLADLQEIHGEKDKEWQMKVKKLEAELEKARFCWQHTGETLLALQKVKTFFQQTGNFLKKNEQKLKLLTILNGSGLTNAQEKTFYQAGKKPYTIQSWDTLYQRKRDILKTTEGWSHKEKLIIQKAFLPMRSKNYKLLCCLESKKRRNTRASIEDSARGREELQWKWNVILISPCYV